MLDKVALRPLLRSVVLLAHLFSFKKLQAEFSKNYLFAFSSFVINGRIIIDISYEST